MNKQGIACLIAVSLDPLSTWIAIRLGSYEGHILWEFLIDEMGLTSAMLFRFFLGLAVILIVIWVIEETKFLSYETLDLLTAVFSLITIWNLSGIFMERVFYEV